MSDAKPTEAEQNTKQPMMDRLTDADWNRYGTLALAAVIGLVVNSLALIAMVGGSAIGIADGVAYLAPVVILAGWVHDRYNPIADTAFLGPAVLFITVLVANTVSLSVRVFRMGGQSEPLMSAMILGILALMFTPGAFLAVWAVRRWGL